MLAKKMTKSSVEIDKNTTLAILGSGAVGALAYTFTDSFWFSAVEGEVYAMSSFFTAIVFWAILKWDLEDDHYSSIEDKSNATSSKQVDPFYLLHDRVVNRRSLIELTSHTCHCICYLFQKV